MPRPRKWRKVCAMPLNALYGPLNAIITDKSIISMSIEEYETVRLIDLQGFMQEAAAEQMNVARTTVQRIYNDARKKIAESLVNGKMLRIEGGDYLLCSGSEPYCGCGGCGRHRFGNKYSESEGNNIEDSNTNRE